MYPGEDSGVLAAPQAGQPEWEDHIGRGGRKEGEEGLHVRCSSDTGLPTRWRQEDRTETVYPGPSIGPAVGQVPTTQLWNE